MCAVIYKSRQNSWDSSILLLVFGTQSIPATLSPPTPRSSSLLVLKGRCHAILVPFLKAKSVFASIEFQK